MFPASPKIWLINILLAAAIIFFVIMSFDVWTEKNEVIAGIQEAEGLKTVPSDKRIIERVMPPESTYEIVAQKDLFSPDRAESYSGEPESELPRFSEKMIFLYGVVTLGNEKQALVSDPESGSKAAGERPKDKWVRVGDTIGNFTVAAIEKDKIVLKEGADRYEVPLYDESKPVRGKAGTQRSAAPTVVTTGSEPAAGSSPSTSTRATTSESAAKKSEPEGEYKILNTPFGPVKRRIK